MSSAKVVAEVKRRLAAKKVGHTGTLDPDATGLLVCVLNGATKLAQFAEVGRKTYQGVIQLGVRTDTDDLSGRVLIKSEVPSDKEAILAQIPSFEGEIEQVPPQISAVKVAGRRSYARARSGEEVTHQARRVHIYRFEVCSYSDGKLSFQIDCSRGTYIRSVARDLGDKLGCGGALAELRRTASQPFHLRDACSLEQLSTAHVRSCEELFPGCGRLEIGGADLARLRNGDVVPVRSRLDAALAPELDTRWVFYYDRSKPQAPVGLLSRLEDGDWVIGMNMPQ